MSLTFGLFSVILLLCIGTAVFTEVARGLKRGYARAALGLAVVLISLVGSLLATKLVSGLLAQPLSAWLWRFLTDRFDVLESYRADLPSIDSLLTVLVDLLTGPLLFLVFFLLLRLLLRVVVASLSAKHANPSATDPRRSPECACLGSVPCPSYEGAEEGHFRRHDHALGGAVGAVTGFLVAICLLSPLTGSLEVVDTVYDGLNDDLSFNWRTIRIDGDQLERALSPFTDDVMVYIVNRLGGQLLYDTACTAELNGSTVALREEVGACMRIAVQGSDVTKTLNKGGQPTPEQLQSLQALGDSLADSKTACVLAADFMRGASEHWLMHEPFMKVKRPACGEFVDPLMDEVLAFLYYNIDPAYVSDDVKTLLGIYRIALEGGLLENPDMTRLMEVLEDGRLLNEIYAELELNPRMEHLVEHLTDATMEIMACSIDAAGLIPTENEALMDDLAEAVTLVNGMSGTDFAGRVNTMTDYAVHYAKQYGVELPTGMAQMGITAMMEQFSGQEKVTGSEMQAYFDYYINRKSTDSRLQP